jgi:hypothetical protein
LGSGWFLEEELGSFDDGGFDGNLEEELGSFDDGGFDGNLEEELGSFDDGGFDGNLEEELGSFDDEGFDGSFLFLIGLDCEKHRDIPFAYWSTKNMVILYNCSTDMS